MNDSGSTNNPEAVCFTAGPKGAAFGAGVIHAWLASGRKPPRVVAGISAGSMTTAAMQRCYRELGAAAAGGPARETARWTWYRKYLRALSVDPGEAIWRAFPDPVDFTADQPPVHDQSCPGNLLRHEAEGRRHYYILTQFGVWLARLPVRFSSVAELIVHYVRWKEGYGGAANNLLWLGRSGLRIAIGLWWNVLRHPSMFPEGEFQFPEGDGLRPVSNSGWHPLFGWRTWLVALFTGIFFLGLPVALVFLRELAWIQLAIVAAAIGLLASEKTRGPILLAVSKYFFTKLDLQRNLLNPYHLRRRLQELFGDEKVEATPIEILLVTASLKEATQYFCKPGDSLIDQLCAALAVPGIFPPGSSKERSDLIDGFAVRENPLPALFDWLKRPENRNTAARELEDAGDSIYVVYNVPIEPYDPKPHEGEEPIDIVEAAFASLELAKRRDTRQEVRQTNQTARLARLSRESELLKMGAQEIAPPRDIAFQNPWDPKPREVLTATASGCKAAMERLYHSQIERYADTSGKIACGLLMNIVAPERGKFINDAAPGVAEVCAQCPRVLERRAAPDPEAPHSCVTRSFGIAGVTSGEPTAAQFADAGLAPLLRDDHARIVFVASGGVFRGAFHIGTIGALHTSRIKPDLIVGASVGALMGGALAAIGSQSDPAKAGDLLHDLAGVFLRVDREVALTRSFKNAIKQLGVRARRIDLAPSEVRRMVLGGSRADAGYAAAGAPPALIDAISGLFLIPHQKTAEIAGDFVAGHFAEAVNRFLEQVRCETLPSLDIQYALIGVSLLEGVARRLLGERHGVPIHQVQPYRHHGIAFFATTSYLNRRMSLILGRDFLTPDPSYDLIMAGLSSSAFPSVFSPRTESDVVPGRGKSDVFFADGGMFDNLPFLPAIEILEAVQCSSRTGAWKGEPTPESVDEVLAQLAFRREHRDVFIAAGLDADPGPPPAEYDTLVKIYERAGALNANSKIDSFLNYFKRNHTLVEELLTHPGDIRDALMKAPPEDRATRLAYLDRAIDGAVLKVVPASPDHINGTFAFCRSTGMSVERVQKSIADGCYQTLLEISRQASDPAYAALSRSGRKVIHKPGPAAPEQECVWFATDRSRLQCPFAKVDRGLHGETADDIEYIRLVCLKDEAHQQSVQIAAPPAQPMSAPLPPVATSAGR